MDFGSVRNAANFEADFDDPAITITMFPVRKRGQRTFEAGRSDWDVVTSAYRQFATEMGYDVNPPVRGDSGRVWLVTAPKILRTYSLVCGAAEVDVVEEVPVLRWIWVHPLQRGTRSDSTQQLWTRITNEYGRVVPELPCSPAMIRFLQKQDQVEGT